MAKRKTKRRYTRRKKTRRRRKTKPSLLMTAATVNYLAQVITEGGKLEKAKAGDFQGFLSHLLKDAIQYGTGYDYVGGQWRFEDFMRGTGTIIIAGIAKKALTSLGVSRHFNKIPILSKFVSL